MRIGRMKAIITYRLKYSESYKYGWRGVEPTFHQDTVRIGNIKFTEARVDSIVKKIEEREISRLRSEGYLFHEFNLLGLIRLEENGV